MNITHVSIYGYRYIGIPTTLNTIYLIYQPPEVCIFMHIDPTTILSKKSIACSFLVLTICDAHVQPNSDDIGKPKIIDTSKHKLFSYMSLVDPNSNVSCQRGTLGMQGSGHRFISVSLNNTLVCFLTFNKYHVYVKWTP